MAAPPCHPRPPPAARTDPDRGPALLTGIIASSGGSNHPTSGSRRTQSGQDLRWRIRDPFADRSKRPGPCAGTVPSFRRLSMEPSKDRVGTYRRLAALKDSKTCRKLPFGYPVRGIPTQEAWQASAMGERFATPHQRM